MHSGFRSLRSAMPMNIRSSHPGKGMNDEVRRDIDRILAVWDECRARFGGGGDLLFGHFTIADAYYAPVVMRFLTYAPPLPAVARRYVDAVHALPGVAAWIAGALAETEFVAADEPYAQGRAS
jgi:glutathione S-transferase